MYLARVDCLQLILTATHIPFLQLACCGYGFKYSVALLLALCCHLRLLHSCVCLQTAFSSEDNGCIVSAWLSTEFKHLRLHMYTLPLPAFCLTHLDSLALTYWISSNSALHHRLHCCQLTDMPTEYLGRLPCSAKILFCMQLHIFLHYHNSFATERKALYRFYQ